MSYRPITSTTPKAPRPSAVSWALKQTCGSPGEKLVLVAMADLCDAARECFPGSQYLGEITEQPQDAARAALDSLRGIGLIADTGARKGVRHNAIVWRLAVDGPVRDWRPPV